MTVVLTGWYAPDRVSFWRHICRVGNSYYTASVGGTDLREVPSSDPNVVHVSPDLTRVAFARDGRLWMWNVDGAGLLALADVEPSPSFGSDGIASPWSPDGTRLVVRDANGRLSVIRLDGRSPQPLVTPPNTMFAGSSAGGDQLALKVYGAGTITLHVSGADGGGLVALSTGGSYNRHSTWAQQR